MAQEYTKRELMASHTSGGEMRTLSTDLEWLSKQQSRCDLSDTYLEEKGLQTRKDFQSNAPDFEYGITFVESTIAREWLERAIQAEGK